MTSAAHGGGPRDGGGHGTGGAAADRPGISAAVVVRNGRVLMIRRRVPEADLVWQFPAGGIEPGESPERAAVRETLEETGLVVKAVRPLGERVHPQTGRRVVYTACEVVAGEAFAAAPREVADVAWLTRGELPRRVPHTLSGPVREYLDGELPH